MNLKKIIAGTALGISLLMPHVASAQDKQDKQDEKPKISLSLDAMTAPSFEEKQTFTLQGLYQKGRFSAYGFIDVFGPETNKCYGELHLRENVTKNSGMHFELNKGCGGPAVFRTGYVFDIPLPKSLEKKVYANAKVLPLNITPGDLLKEMQIGTYVKADLGKGFYAENWTDYTIPYNSKDYVLTKFTVGKNLTPHIAIQGQAAYNVNSPGWAGLVGLRFKF